MNSNNSCVLLGKIYTIDDSRPEAGGVAIHHGRIAYVGDAKEARRQGGPQAEVIDLAGRVALPGFVESHSHPILLGRYLEEADCRYCSSLEEITETLRQRAKETPPGQWVVGNGYDHTLLKESRHPTRSELDRASEEHHRPQRCGELASARARRRHQQDNRSWRRPNRTGRKWGARRRAVGVGAGPRQLPPS